MEQLNKNAYFGMSELEVFSIGRSIQQKVIKETPFDYLATNILVAAWPSRISYQPHGIPKVSDLLVEGSHISLAFLRVNGYSAELERTFFTSKPTREQEEAFELMIEARRRSYAVLKPGAIAEDVDLAAKQFLIDQGLKDNLMHRTGHGIGLGNHEGPYLAEGDKTVLKENMVVSIEPGIYIEGVGGFRHSDTVLITKNGYQILTDCPDDIKSLTFTNSKPLQKLKGNIIKKIYKL
nr:M24 family metallopeptidase [Maribacter sp. Hal144]